MEELFDSQPPPDLPMHLCWRCVKVTPGSHGPFMVAGAGWGGAAHYNGKRTLPCVAKLPKAKMECHLCKRVQRYAFYAPVFAVTALKQQMIVIQGAKRTEASFKLFKFGELVQVMRGKGERDTAVFVKGDHRGATLDLEKFRRRGPQVITPYLLHLWQWRELSEAYGQHYYPSVRSLEIEKGERKMEDDGPRDFKLE